MTRDYFLRFWRALERELITRAQVFEAVREEEIIGTDSKRIAVFYEAKHRWMGLHYDAKQRGLMIRQDFERFTIIVTGPQPDQVLAAQVVASAEDSGLIRLEQQLLSPSEFAERVIQLISRDDAGNSIGSERSPDSA